MTDDDSRMRRDKLVSAKTEAPSLGGELKSLFREIDENYKGKRPPSEREILSSISSHRHDKRRS